MCTYKAGERQCVRIVSSWSPSVSTELSPGHSVVTHGGHACVSSHRVGSLVLAREGTGWPDSVHTCPICCSQEPEQDPGVPSGDPEAK